MSCRRQPDGRARIMHGGGGASPLHGGQRYRRPKNRRLSTGDPQMQHHPLIDRLTGEHGFPLLTSPQARDAFIRAAGDHVLFIPADPARDAETADLARMLPELRLAFRNAFDCAVVDEAIEADTREMTADQRTPSLIIYRDGLQIGMLHALRDRTDHMSRIGQILASRTELCDT